MVLWEPFTRNMSSNSSPPYSRPIPIAPAPNGNQTQESSNDQACMTYACLTCSKRKVKCDKTAPVCATCRKARLECIYQEPAPRKRKRKPTDDLQERLDHYEKLLKDNGIQTNSEILKTPPVETEPAFYISRSQPPDSATGAKLVGPPGKSRYIGSNLWRHLADDLQPSSDEEEEDDAVEEDITSTYQIYQTNSKQDPVSLRLARCGLKPSASSNCHCPGFSGTSFTALTQCKSP